MPIAAVLAQWQKAGDALLFKLIVSPEFGERMDLRRHTRELLQRMEQDLATSLQWVAIAHFNTEHAHVHIALRGCDATGQPLRIARQYVKSGMRDRAQELATNQLGYRTHEDARLAAELQVIQQRFTELDRSLQKRANNGKNGDGARGLRIDFAQSVPREPEARERRVIEIRRLQQLVSMGLATKTGPLSWELHAAFETALRQMQMGADRLKALHRQHATVSDPRLPLVLTETRTIRRLAGRVIGTGLDEQRGVPYLILESVDAKVHYLYNDKAIDEARHAGLLRSGSFAELERRFVSGEDGRKHWQIAVTDRGNAETLLKDEGHLSAEAVRRALGQTELPKAGSFGGWLGRYQAAVARQAQRLADMGSLRSGPRGYEHVDARGRSHVRR